MSRRDDPSRDPRSLYLSTALVEEVRRFADASRRTYSAQLCHFAELGLGVADRIDFEVRSEMDDVAQRQHFYPDGGLDLGIERLVKKHELTYSAATRALVQAGIALARSSACRNCGPSRSTAEAVDHA